MSLTQRKTPRAQRYDYTSPGGYFITICTQDREQYFGEVIDGTMILNELGQYCHDYIAILDKQRKTIDIHEWIVMPNHIHLLFIITEFTSQMNEPYIDIRKNNPIDNRRDDLLGRPLDDGDNLGHPNDKGYANGDGYANGHAKSMSLQEPTIPLQEPTIPLQKPITYLQTPTINPSYQGPRLGSVINMFKGAITKYAREHDIVFARQGRYHDHIIRDEGEYQRIKYYIETNPKNRNNDSLR